ncbi:MAG TPA: hypothetical protein VGL46_13310 [Pseudonocardiaceae bacterium]|jgi:hypothetical protein
MTELVGWPEITGDGPRHRAPGWLRGAVGALRGLASRSRRKTLVTGAKALVVAIQGRFTLAQFVGGAAASTGVFLEWGAAIGLMVTGIAVLTASTVLERQA